MNLEGHLYGGLGRPRTTVRFSLLLPSALPRVKPPLRVRSPRLGRPGPKPRRSTLRIMALQSPASFGLRCPLLTLSLQSSVRATGISRQCSSGSTPPRYRELAPRESHPCLLLASLALRHPARPERGGRGGTPAARSGSAAEPVSGGCWCDVSRAWRSRKRRRTRPEFPAPVSAPSLLPLPSCLTSSPSSRRAGLCSGVSRA